MVLQGLSEILALILASGGPERQLARVSWPMHVALRETHDEAGRRGQRSPLGVLEFRSSPEVGLEVVGAESAVQQLLRSGVLYAEGEGRGAELVLDRDAAVALRRRVMRLSAEQASLLQRAGARWAALASTAAKNRSTAPRSSAETVESGTPNRRKLALAEGA